MHAIAHRGCTDTVREFALEVDCGTEKSLASPGFEPTSVLPLGALPTELYLAVAGFSGPVNSTSSKRRNYANSGSILGQRREVSVSVHSHIALPG